MLYFIKMLSNKFQYYYRPVHRILHRHMCAGYSCLRWSDHNQLQTFSGKIEW